MEFHKPSGLRDYIVAGGVGLVFFLLTAWALWLRYGYFIHGPATSDSWYLPNKAIAGAAALLIALTFLLGPLSRYFNRFDSWLAYRKELGIVGGGLAVFHGLVTFFLLPKKFPQETVISSVQSAPWGVLGAVVLVVLFLFSFQKAITLLGSSRWWFLHRWGLRLAIFFTLLHIGLMKGEGYLIWFEQGSKSSGGLLHPEVVPTGLVVALFVAWVTLVRLYESIFLFRSFGFATKEIAMDEVLHKRGRRFFLGSLAITTLLLLVVIFRW